MKYLQSGDSIALISGERTLSYTELCAVVSRYAALFPGQCSKIAIYSENRPEWIYAFYAGWRNGCAVVPIDAVSLAEDVAYILEDCRPEVFFCSRRKLPEVETALKSVSYAPKVLVFEEHEIDVPEAARPDVVFERHDDETALIIYTSGTTGSPKGAMLTFGNVAANVDAVSKDVRMFTPDARLLILLPLHHILPLAGTLLAPLAIGATCVFCPSLASKDILETLQRHGVTIIVGVPRLFSLIMKGVREKIRASLAARMLFALAKRLDNPDLSKKIFRKVHERFGGKVRYIFCGGAAIDEEVARDFKALGFDLITGYGMTETAPIISFTRPGTLRIGASGQASSANEIRIVEEVSSDDEEAPSRSGAGAGSGRMGGEITVRGRNVMRGYYNRPEATAEMIRDGWLHTGDLGYLDSDGFLFVTGRKKDIIVLSNGKNINPEELEAKLLSAFDVVNEAAVCLHMDVLHAVIVPDREKLAEKKIEAVEEYFRREVIGKFNRKVAPTKRIMKFTLVDEELPKTRLGKIRRFQLPELISK